MEPILLTASEAADALGVSRTTVYELMGAGTLESVRSGRSRRVPAQALRAYVERLRDDTARDAA